MEKERIINLAKECLQCKNPTCIEGCPAHNNIPMFIKLFLQNKIEEAKNVLDETTTLPSICSLVCPSEKQCKGHCVKNKINNPVKINEIEHYIAINSSLNKMNQLQNKNKKVAIVGSGPSGLACSEILAKNGYIVDVYEQHSQPGGILTYGIPDFVLNKDIVKNKIQELNNLKINFILNKKLGKEISINFLSNNYDAVFIGVGATIGKKMNVDNEDLIGIVDANEFLYNMSLNKNLKYAKAKKIAVIGGGNTAIDAARVAKRKISNDVSIIYRRGIDEMPARVDEINKAIEDGIEFKFLTNPVRFIGNDNLTSMECIKMELINEENKRPRPVEIRGSEFIMDVDLVIEALSSTIDTAVLDGIKTHLWGGIVIDENMKTSIENVFAAGDCVTGPSLVVSAMKDGIKAAKKIINYLK